MRSGYVTKRGVVVKPSMVKNMGRPGKGFPGGGIGKLKSGVLGKYGYSKVTTLTKRQRHVALNKAIRGMMYGKGMTMRRALVDLMFIPDAQVPRVLRYSEGTGIGLERSFVN